MGTGEVCVGVCVREREKENKQNKGKTDSKKQKDGDSVCRARTRAWSSCRVSARSAHLNRFLAFPEATGAVGEPCTAYKTRHRKNKNRPILQFRSAG